MQTMRLVLTLALLIQIIVCITTPSTTVYIKYFNRVVDGVSYPSYQLQGSGPNWQDTGAGMYGLVFPGSANYTVQVVNQLEEQTIVHAHGLLPPSTQDGVPYFSAVPIFPQRSQVYQFALNNQNGTYFLHSHFGFQLGNGLTVPLIISGNDVIYPLYSELEAAYDSAILLEDLCASTTMEYDKKLELAIEAGLATPRQDINRNAPRQKGDCSSWATFLKLAYVFNTTGNNQSAMCPGVEPATDSDVFYEKYLLNGQTYESPRVVYKSDLFDAPIRIRFINSGGMTNFQLVFPFSVTLVATDGAYVEPFVNNTFWIAVAQRLDVLVQVPEGWGEYFNVTAYSENSEKSVPTVIIYSTVDLSGSQASAIGTGIASVPYATGMMDNILDQTVQAFKPLPAGDVTKQLDISLTGDNGFRGINNKSYRLPPTGSLPYVPNEFPLLVSYGDRVRMVIQNFNPDSHPMHLHGHVFQIVEINGKSVNGPMRDVALVPGGCNNVTLEFEANNPGIWAFHCHLEFHSAAGMLTSLEYTN